MIPSRLQVKFFLENPATLDLAPVGGVFQRWIQKKALEGLLIDVADYRHVFEGPGTVLIGHESDYAIENQDGRPGLLYTRKRQPDPDLQTQLRASLRLALTACQLLEAETTFKPKLKFRADEIQIRFADRLQLPNRPETFEVVKDDVEAVLAELYGPHSVSLAPVSQEPRHLFTVDIRGGGAVGVAELLSQLQARVEK